MKLRRSKMHDGAEIICIKNTEIVHPNTKTRRYTIKRGKVFKVAESVPLDATNETMIKICQQGKRNPPILEMPLLFARKDFNMFIPEKQNFPEEIFDPMNWRVVDWFFEGSQIGWQIVRGIEETLEVGASYEFRGFQ